MSSIDCRYIAHKETLRFSNLVTDYLKDEETLRPFYHQRPDVEGIKNFIQEKVQQDFSREVLVEVFKRQYAGHPYEEKVRPLIDLLAKENSYTVTTAHQTNLLLGPVYMIYKIMHAAVLADFLQKEIPNENFIAIYYAGSEDDDWEELDHFYWKGKKYQWKTNQTGAFGSAKVDESLIQLINTFLKDIQATDYQFYQSIEEGILQAYQLGNSITEANKLLIHYLFKNQDLLVLDADDADLKEIFIPVLLEELKEQNAIAMVEESSRKLNEHYKAQAYPRPINLFYLSAGKRERIVFDGHQYHLADNSQYWSVEEMYSEVKNNPKAFSPNVILRPLYQEMILPNVAFVGGGSEVAYWMQLKDLFHHYTIPFPVLILRQSVEMVELKNLEAWENLGLNLYDLFKTEDQLIKTKAKTHLPESIDLNGIKDNFKQQLLDLEEEIKNIDSTLTYSLKAVEHKIQYQLNVLDQKLLRAQKRKLMDLRNNIYAIQKNVFPYGGGLSERKEGYFDFYGIWSEEWMDLLFKNTKAFGEEFLVMIKK